MGKLTLGENGTEICSGFLFKKPEKSLLWKKRYCVLFSNQLSIMYYETIEKAEEGILRGKIPFSSIHNWEGKPNGFQFYTPSNKCYRVYADTAEEKEMWMEKMQKQIDDAPETKAGEYPQYSRPVAHSIISNASDGWSERDTAANSAEVEDDLINMELEDMRNEVVTLRAELMAYKALESEITSDPRSRMVRRGSVLDDGTMLNMVPSEMERMRQIFNLFDAEGNGFINAEQLEHLHLKLGEPISKELAQEAIDFIDPVDGQVDFTSFMKWWNEDHKGDDRSERMKRYQAKFKFIKARIANPAIGRIETEGVGPFPSFEFRLNYFYVNDDGSRVQISPWHDIPLYNADGSVNFICEIPKWTRKKMEIATGEPFNPIKQDTKNGKLREYVWGDMMFNYGALPQTWEDPAHTTEGTGCIGDNDPIDVVEIGTKQWGIGAVVQVKILGVLALIDSGETDWKLICINVEDHYAPMINDVADVEAHMPGCIKAIHDWLRDYKLPKVNKYGYNGKCMNKEFAESVVHETHEFWKDLIQERGAQATV